MLRRDGFISLDAGEEEGALTTLPFTLNGSRLYVNVEAPAGEVRAEALDETGRVLASSGPLKGDHPRGELQWQQGLAQLQGQVVSLRYALRSANLYSYWLED